MIPRDNCHMREAVEHGLILDAVKGAAWAWAYMTAHEVPRLVILRVLTSPERRRPGDTAILAQSQQRNNADHKRASSIRLTR